MTNTPQDKNSKETDNPVAKSYEENDLAAQTRMANAAVDTVKLTKKSVKFTGFGLIITSIAVLVSIGAAGLTAISIINAEKRSYVELRPWVDFGFDFVKGQQFSGVGDDTRELIIMEKFYNYGKTPTGNAELAIRLFPQSATPIENLVQDEVNSACEALISGNHPPQVKIRDIGKIVPKGHEPALPPFREAIAAPESEIGSIYSAGHPLDFFLIGCIRYTNFQGSECHLSPFAYQIVSWSAGCDQLPVGIMAEEFEEYLFFYQGRVVETNSLCEASVEGIDTQPKDCDPN